MPQRCPVGSNWDGSKCVFNNGLCPAGTYKQGESCYPFEACKNNFVWDPNYLRCVCPPGTIDSGNSCVVCPYDQKWNPATGCACPVGSFDTGASCESANPSKCSVIPNAYWNNNRCECRPGFDKVGFQCICYGTQTGTFCDKCSYKPNSAINTLTDTCECNVGFTEIKGVCIKAGSQVGNDSPNNCAVGTFFNTAHKMCLACPDGCLSCSDCYNCRVCKPEYRYDSVSQKCFELCGDGKKFDLECDDGNNVDGDGCSRDCRIEPGFKCTGGSPDSNDRCVVQGPGQTSITQVGQIRRCSTIVLNLKLDFLPKNLMQSNECQNKCNQILNG